MWSKKPRVGSSADAPAAPLPKADTARVNADKREPGANPPQPRRHRLAGSHDGMYVTEHHRGRKR